MRTVTVTGAVIGKGNITLFFADGNSEVLAQEGYRTAEILDQVMPKLAKQEHPTIDLETFSIAKKIAEVTGGAVKAVDTTADTAVMMVGGVEVSTEGFEDHIERAALDKSKGFANFMKKFNEVKRKHTIQELTTFLKGADLPFAEDGSILGFKILGDYTKFPKHSADVMGTMRDHHSQRVPQRLGSLVYMPDSKVDDNRRNACGTGLHIAARGYLSGFWQSNSRLCLVKIQPKDVISVPINESSKMRVAAYHIVKVFSEADGEAIRRGKDIHDIPSALKMLEEAVHGFIGPINERVEVKMDNTVVVTPVAAKPERVAAKKVKKAKPVSRVSKVVKKTGPKVEPADARILNKLIKAKPHLAELENSYLKKLIRGQKLLNDGKSLRFIAERLGVDRDALSRNLIKKAA